jgi:hypothetical protein
VGGTHRGGGIGVARIGPSLLVAWVPFCVGVVVMLVSLGCGWEWDFFATVAIETNCAGNIKLCDKDYGNILKTKMVYYFTSNTVSPDAFIYVGKDKVESKCLSPFK